MTSGILLLIIDTNHKKATKDIQDDGGTEGFMKERLLWNSAESYNVWRSTETAEHAGNEVRRLQRDDIFKKDLLPYYHKKLKTIKRAAIQESE